MARSLANKPNVQPPVAPYPFGRIKDNPGNNTGTPVNELVYGDFHQFFEKLMNTAGLTANELPDNATNGFQLFEALLKKFASDDGAAGRKFKEVEITDWNMTNHVEKSVHHGISDSTKIKNVYATIFSDSGIQHMLHKVDTSNIIHGGYGQISIAAVALIRLSGGDFDNSDYSGTGFRGYLTIEYVD